jgi:cysteine desulfurase
LRPYIEESYGNPETLYHLGFQAKEAVDKARRQVADLLDCSPEGVFFTSGGTESNNWALKGFRGRRILVSAIEHPSVTKAAAAAPLCSLRIIPVDAAGLLKMDALEKALTPDELNLVSVQYANNEIGTIQPIGDIAALVHDKGAILHVDAVQAFGKIPVFPELDGIDLLSISAHKIHGPMGVGALYVSKNIKLDPMIHGGPQENGMRAGTSPVHQIVGFGAAAEIARCTMKREEPRQRELVNRLATSLAEMAGGVRNGHPEKTLPNILSMQFPKVDAAMLAATLNKEFGICVACGAACSRGRPSQVLKALGQDDAQASRAIRISISRRSE